jgi:hypothetical protein
MLAMLLRLVGIDVRRLAQEAAITVVLALFAVFAAILALTLGLVALYLWLELKLGIFAALGILGGTSALVAIALFAVAFRRVPRKPGAGAEDALRAAANPAQAAAATIARAADEALTGSAEIVRNGSRQQVFGTIAAAAIIGWLLARRS